MCGTSMVWERVGDGPPLCAVFAARRRRIGTMESRDRTREPGPRAGTKPVKEDDPLEKLRDRSGRSGAFPREDLPLVEQQEVVKDREVEPSDDFSRRGDVETERPDQEGPFPDRGRSDEESGRPVQLGGKKHDAQEPTTEARRQ
jgi:hypothetical protein